LGSAKDATAYFFTDTLPWMITQVGYEIQDKIWDIKMWGSEIYQGVLDGIANMKKKIEEFYDAASDNLKSAQEALTARWNRWVPPWVTALTQLVPFIGGGSGGTQRNFGTTAAVVSEQDTSDDKQYNFGGHAAANRTSSVTVRSQRENISPHEQTSSTPGHQARVQAIERRSLNINPHEQTRMFHFGGSNGGGPRVVMGNPGSMQQGGGAVSNRQVNVTINSSLSVNDIVRDVERLESMNEAAFFNTI